MPTEMIKLVHPERKDTKTVSKAAAKTHRKAGWITEDEAAELAQLADLDEQALADVSALSTTNPDEPVDTDGESTSSTSSWMSNDESQED